MDPVRTSTGTVTMLTIFKFYLSPLGKFVGYYFRLRWVRLGFVTMSKVSLGCVRLG